MRKILAAFPVALALALAGCGSGDDGGDDVASAGGAATTTAGAPAVGGADMGLKFAQCMRENGVPMDDPVDGKITMKIDGSIPRETVDKAQEACRQYNPQENGAAKSDPKMEQAARDFAVCMRENGVEAFPDPEPGQKGIRIEGSSASDPDFEQASQKCQEVLAGARG
ncbi:hypothetical protein GCM10017786_32350 [Amycolatopsis deserti]|uniref:Lipoprotein n=1 Tax=Amycolatopsis deserti TaxID=185696 RepID=A0ABQ3IZY4_9PSEU|nr:hypothetical protein [Amycolatopsis deserti]GHE97203.1 hypothetical protein GCM10017786_32350 [Amycolatopsis deserti]